MAKTLHAVQTIGIAFLLAISLPVLVRLGSNVIAPIKFEKRIDGNYQSVENQSIRARNADKREARETQFFYISLICALAFAVAGMFISISSISIGLIFGASFTAINGYIHSWSYISEIFKFISLLAMLALLIVFVIVQHKKRK